MPLTIAYSKIKKRNLVLINNDTYQRETLSERPIRLPLNLHITFASKFNMINKDLEEVTDWFKASRLSANASKTNYMPLGTNHKSS